MDRKEMRIAVKELEEIKKEKGRELFELILKSGSKEMKFVLLDFINSSQQLDGLIALRLNKAIKMLEKVSRFNTEGYENK